MNSLLLKGFEVELFTGMHSGENIGVSEAVTKEFSDFVKEPDQRNLEYITQPEQQYETLKESLLAPRRKLREWLNNRDLTTFDVDLGTTEKLIDEHKLQLANQDILLVSESGLFVRKDLLLYQIGVADSENRTPEAKSRHLFSTFQKFVFSKKTVIHEYAVKSITNCTVKKFGCYS